MFLDVFTWWCGRTLLQYALSCTTLQETSGHISLHNQPVDVWSRRSGGQSCPAMQPEQNMYFNIFYTTVVLVTYLPMHRIRLCALGFKLSLTSWFSWKSTRYSERCCLMNFLMISCLMRGSRTLATKQASLSTLLGPPGLWMEIKDKYKIIYREKEEQESLNRHKHPRKKITQNKHENLDFYTAQHIYLGALRREGFFKICQDLSPQFTLCCFYS